MSNRRQPSSSPTLDDALVDEVKAERIDSSSGPDSPEGRALGAAVGRNLAELRTDRGMALETVAERSGIRVALLRALENGRAVPSLRAIWHLATALRVPFGRLLAHTALSRGGDADFFLQRAPEGHVIRSADGRFASRPLFAEGDPRAPEVYELTLAPGCVEDALPHAPMTFEHLTVVRGRLRVRSEGSVAELGPGDALFFRADRPHGYENPGLDETVVHLVMSYGPG